MAITRNLSPTDVKIARICMALASILTTGLFVTGALLFAQHEPSTAWSAYAPGADRPEAPLPSGMSGFHGALGDLVCILGLFIVTWISYRVIQRISWASLSGLILMVVAIVTGGLIRFNATISNGVADVTTVGYRQLFGGTVDIVATDTSDLGIATAQVLTVAHVSLLPAAVVGTAVLVRRWSSIVPETHGPSWIEQLG